MHLYSTSILATTIAGVPSISPRADGTHALVIIAIAAVLIGFICSALAVSIYVRLVNARREAASERKRDEQAIALRDRLLNEFDEDVSAFSTQSSSPIASQNAGALLQACMSGPDGKMLAGELEGLLNRGIKFKLTVRKPLGGRAYIRGIMTADGPVVFSKDLGATDTTIDFQQIVDAIPSPVWLRNSNLGLRWANKAFLTAANAPSLEAAIATNAVLEKSEMELAEAARVGNSTIEAIRYAPIHGSRKALALYLTGLEDRSVAGYAADLTETKRSEAKLRLTEDAVADVLEAVPFGMAFFNEDGRLTSCNAAYAQILDVDPDWLDAKRTMGEILDRLRDGRQVPEQYDYQAWKREQLQLFKTCSGPIEQFWHLTNGKSIRIQMRPHLLGGFFFVVEDMSEKLRLESSFRLLNQVQRATLDAIDEAIAIFAPDGHLVLHNSSFARLWQLTDAELARQPHFKTIAHLCEARLGRDAIWSIVAAGITSEEPERCNDWGKTRRGDGRTISVSMSRLPNGATAVTFADLTDLEQFQRELANDAPEKSDAAA
jgi:PAS domain-containing protein